MEKPSHKFEHQFLREELTANKKLVFERALLIAAAGFAAIILPNKAEGVQLIGVPTIGALGFSLWLTVNRLNSNARIISYIQLFHEGEGTLPWVGWENSLRLHRIWHNRFCGRLERIQDENYPRISQYDNLSFYRPILFLHLSMAILVAALMSFVAWLSEPLATPLGSVPTYVTPVINGLLVIALCLWSVRYRPSRLQTGIERNRLIWCAVLEAYNRGELADA